jgi:hypothetical protein
MTYFNNAFNSLSVFNLNSLLNSINNDTDNKAWLYEDKVQHPLEHYLAKVETLNVQQL